MKKPLVTLVATLVATLSFALLTACSGPSSAAGLYDIDKPAFKQSMLSSMPPAQKENKEAMAAVDAMIDSLSVTVDLKADGSAALDMKMKVGDRPMDNSTKGTWKLDGNKLTITTQKNGKDDPKTVDFDGKTFTIEQDTGGQAMKMTFHRR